MERVREVDVVKGLAILAVVLLHISTTFVEGVGRAALGGMWQVAVLFLVGGFFVKDRDDFVWRKIRRLFVPAVVMYVMAAMCHNVFVWLGWYPEGMLSPSDGKPLEMWGWSEYGVGLLKALIGYGEPVMGAMWFVYVLLFAHVGLHYLKRVVRSVWVLLAILFVLQCVSWCATWWGYTVPRVNNTLSVMMLVELGRLFWMNRWRMDELSGAKRMVVSVGALLVAVGGLFVVGNVSLNKNYYHNPVTLDVVSVAVLVVLLDIARWMERWTGRIAKVVAYIGRHSYSVMAGHILGFYVATSLLRLFYRNIPIYRNTALIDPAHWYVGVVYLFMGVCVPLCIGWVVRRFCSGATIR